MGDDSDVLKSIEQIIEEMFPGIYEIYDITTNDTIGTGTYLEMLTMYRSITDYPSDTVGSIIYNIRKVETKAAKVLFEK